ncbi:Uncharacterized protein PBTT_09554 [Plasmodiophora brassicae]
MTGPPARAHINPLLLTRDLLGQTDPADDLVDVTGLVAGCQTAGKLTVDSRAQPVDVRQALGACLGNLYLATGRIRTNPCDRVSLLRSLLSQLVDFGDRLQSSRNECEELVEAACSLLVHLPKSNFADARELHSTLEEALSALMPMRPGDVHLDAPSELERTYLLSKKSKNAYVDVIGDANDIDFLPKAVFVRSEGLGGMGIKGWAGYRHVIMVRPVLPPNPNPKTLLEHLAVYTHERVHVEARWRAANVNISTPDDTEFGLRHVNQVAQRDRPERGRCVDVLLFGKQINFRGVSQAHAAKILEDWARDQESWSEDVLAIFDDYPEYRSTYFCVCGARPSRIFM